jgi:hypothetical protein
MRRINLQKARVCRQRIQLMHSFPAQVIAADAAQDCRMASQASSHDAEICWRAAQSLPLR